jgi:FkbM family methyltransferase
MLSETSDVLFLEKKIKYYTPNSKTKKRVKRIHEKEPLTNEWISEIQNGTSLLDIGANVGMYTMMAAVTKDIKVYSIEPENNNYFILCHNILLNKVSDRVLAFNAGALDYNGYSVLNINNNDGFGGALHSVEEELDDKLNTLKPIHKQGLHVMRIDSFVEKMNIQPEYIKIDVDGLEHRVVEGALKTIKNAKTIIIELDLNLQKHKDTIDKIKDLGFSLKNDKLRKGHFGEHWFTNNVTT